MCDREYDQPPSSRGVPQAEASADTEAANTNTRKGVMASEQIQVPQSPQSLSLQTDGVTDRVYDKIDSTGAYIESSECGSDTSVDGQRPEIQSASTFPDSLPSSSLNDSTRSMELDNPKENERATSTYQNALSHQDQLRAQPTKGDAALEQEHDAVKTEDSSQDSLPPLRSPAQLESRIRNGTHFTPGHKRTATGDIKSVSSGIAALHSSDVNGVRRRSKSTGAPTHGGRIAQLSVHIRTRLSYAAAKIEKSRQSQAASTQLPLRGLESLPAWKPSVHSNAHSTPSSPPASSPQHKPYASCTNVPHLYPSHHRSQSAISSPGKLAPASKLAPPVDITSNGDTRRRRPNPNINSGSSEYSPHARHRRHHSHQDPPAARFNNSMGVLGPGTPNFTPSSYAPLSAQGELYRSRTQSESTSMEQDAIETLLFMSSPENSGYRSSPRPLQPPATQNVLNATIYSDGNGTDASHGRTTPNDNSQQHTRPSQGARGPRPGLESRAGDEIDRLLDQMDSDSEDESRYGSHRRVTSQTNRGQA
ncbi:hypothetical protein N7492_006042 [Penicillium capsulatum]|uniref:Uncharacterized protein n=1 Tax=Penicillium capsulatum TaxID=69766 RepID=A0A9W9ICH6_9EURO|nr:hypothetical protein N7492_006042 [Penicillium capsulatum]KAJ6134854.1 hypothetical protein N7512_000014 [Penicillium capsulatum]